MTHIQEDLSLSPSALERLDDMTLQAFRKLNKSFLKAVASLAPPSPTDEMDSETRDLHRTRLNVFTQLVLWPRQTLCSDISTAQDAFAALCKGQQNDMSERAPAQQFQQIQKALAHQSVLPDEVCPGYKGTKSDMKRQAAHCLNLGC